MSRLFLKTGLLLLAVSLLASVSCKKGKKESTAFDRAAAIKKLESIHSALVKKDYDELMNHLAKPPKITMDQVKKAAPRLLERSEISAAGIKVLDKKATFGKMTKLFPNKAARWAKRYGIGSPGACWALKYERAEAAFCMLGGKWKAVRIDDIGKVK